MNYNLIYQVLCQRGQDRADTRKEADMLLGYSEWHHIIPTCMGGPDTKDNKVFLSAREHYVAHQLLMKIFPANVKIMQAACIMAANSHGLRPNNRTYEWIKLRKSSLTKGVKNPKHGNIMRGRTKETHTGNAAQSEKMKGRTAETHESVKKGAEMQRGRTKENHEGIARGAEKRKGRTKETHTGNAAQSEKMKGRTAETHIGIARTAEKKRGRTKETCDGVARTSQANSKISKEQKELLFEMKKSGMRIIDIYHEFQKLDYKLSYSLIGRYFRDFEVNVL